MSAVSAVRLARVADLDTLEELENAVFTSDELSRRSLRYYITAPTACFLVMQEGSRIVGDAIVAFRRGARVARLYSIAIRSDCAGRGLGRRLLAACERAVASRDGRVLRLEVRADNGAAVRLYRSAGFVAIGEIPDYYEDGTTALRFEKSIAPVSGGNEPVEEQRSS